MRERHERPHGPTGMRRGARSTRYDPLTKRIVVELRNGATFMFPAELTEGLAGASPKDLAEVRVNTFGRRATLAQYRCRFKLAAPFVWRVRIKELDGKAGSQWK